MQNTQTHKTVSSCSRSVKLLGFLFLAQKCTWTALPHPWSSTDIIRINHANMYLHVEQWKINIFGSPLSAQQIIYRLNRKRWRIFVGTISSCGWIYICRALQCGSLCHRGFGVFTGICRQYKNVTLALFLDWSDRELSAHPVSTRKRFI